MRLAGRGHGAIDVLGATLRDAGQNLARGGIDRLERLARGRFHPLPADEQLLGLLLQKARNRESLSNGHDGHPTPRRLELFQVLHNRLLRRASDHHDRLLVRVRVGFHMVDEWRDVDVVAGLGPHPHLLSAVRIDELGVA